jgi:uncharacterized surface protein with fasciclin (FAS1) repeats
MRNLKGNSIATITLAAIAVFGLAACSSTSGSGTTAAKPKPSHSATQAPNPAAADLVGSGCAGYASQVPSGAGSIVGMSQDPVAVAASNNPLLKTLVAAVSGKLNPKVNLVSTLDGGQFTVFAPVDSAFAKLPAATVAALAKPENAKLLSSILTYHVIAGQILPADIDGMHKTVQGDMVDVTGSGNSIKVNDSNVICGGVHTANATVYLIDTVLSVPAAKK